MRVDRQTDKQTDNRHADTVIAILLKMR